MNAQIGWHSMLKDAQIIVKVAKISMDFPCLKALTAQPQQSLQTAGKHLKLPGTKLATCLWDVGAADMQ